MRHMLFATFDGDGPIPSGVEAGFVGGSGRFAKIPVTPSRC